MDKVKRYKLLYQKHLITKEQLQKIVELKILTQDEYNEIVGETN